MNETATTYKTDSKTEESKSYTCDMVIRQALLAVVVAIENKWGIKPTTAWCRRVAKEMKK